MPAKLETEWGPAHIKALAQLVSRVARSVEGAVGDPFGQDENLSWDNNPFTHAAVSAAIAAILAQYKPEGPVQTPAHVKKGTEWIAREMGEEQANLHRTPESVGLMCARGVLDRVARQKRRPKPPPGGHLAEGYEAYPNIRKILGEPNK